MTVIILLIDDERYFAQTAVRYIESRARHVQRDMRVFWAQNLSDTERLVIEKDVWPDLVLLDNDFSKAGGGIADGVKLIHPRFALWAQKLNRPRPPRIILLTGRPELFEDIEEAKRDLYSVGVYRIVEKEQVIESDRLFPIIEKALDEGAGGIGDAQH